MKPVSFGIHYKAMDFQDRNSFTAIYENMILGPPQRDISQAREWLKKHKIFDCWIDGRTVEQTTQIFFEVDHELSGTVKTRIARNDSCIDSAILSSSKAGSEWSKNSLLNRVNVLHRISQNLQMKRELFSQLCHIQGQKNEFDLFLDYFNFYSNLLIGDENLKPVGVVLIILSHITPAWFLAMNVAAAFWAGCSVIVKPSKKAPFFTFLLAEICSESGLLDGLLNIVPCTRHVCIKKLVPKCSKIVYGGNHAEELNLKSHFTDMGFSTLIPGHTASIILDSCDLQAAVDKLFNETWKFNHQSTWSTDLVVVQESIYKDFMHRMAKKINGFDSQSENLFKFSNETAKLKLNNALVEAQNMNAIIVGDHESEAESFSGPILVAEYEMCLDGANVPAMTVLVSRTAKEAAYIVNNSPYCLATSIWSENIAQAMEISSHLESNIVWINCHGVMNSSISFEPLRKSGFGSFGGLKGGLAYTSPASNIIRSNNPSSFGKVTLPVVEKSYETFQKWKTEKCKTTYLLNVLRSIMENDGNEESDVLSEYNEKLYYWALRSNSFEDGTCKLYKGFYTIVNKKPFGVMAMVLRNTTNIAKYFLTWVTPAIALGNVVIVVIPADVKPNVKSIMQHFLNNLPHGVVTVIEDIAILDELIPNQKINAVWFDDSSEACKLPIWDQHTKFKHKFTSPLENILCEELLENYCLKCQVIQFPIVSSANSSI